MYYYTFRELFLVVVTVAEDESDSAENLLQQLENPVKKEG